MRPGNLILNVRINIIISDTGKNISVLVRFDWSSRGLEVQIGRVDDSLDGTLSCIYSSSSKSRVLFARCIFCKIVKAGIQELLRAELDEQREPRERAR